MKLFPSASFAMGAQAGKKTNRTACESFQRNNCDNFRVDPLAISTIQSLSLSCQQKIQDLKCTELKSPPGFLKKCSEKEVCNSLDLNVSEILEGCGEGFYKYGEEAVEDFEKQLKNSIKNAQALTKCNTDLNQKKRIFDKYNRSVPPLLQKKLFSDSILSNWSCSQIQENIHSAYLLQLQYAEKKLILFETENPKLINNLNKYPAELRGYKLWKIGISNEQLETIRKKINAIKNSPEAFKNLVNHLPLSLQKLMAELETRWGCYNSEALTEIVCRAIAPEIVQTLAGVGIALSATKLIELYEITKSSNVLNAVEDLALVEKRGQDILDTDRRGFKEISSAKQQAKRNKFMEKYANKEIVSTAEKARYKALAESVLPGQENPNLHFVVIKHSKFGELNNVYKQEDVVTAMGHFRQDLDLQKLRSLEKEIQKSDPNFRMTCFNNHSNLSCASEGKLPDDFAERVDKIQKENQVVFDRELKGEHEVIRQTDETDSWYRTVISSTDDEANLAERYARLQTDGRVIDSQKNSDYKAWAEKQFSALQTSRKKLEEQLKDTSLLEKKPGSPPELKTSAIDIIRKNDQDLENTKELLKTEFGLSDLSIETVQEMKLHVDSLKIFSPDPRVVARGNASLRDSNFGGIAVDMKQLGAENLNVTGHAVAEARDLKDALRKSRNAEQKLTDEIDERRKNFQELVTSKFGTQDQAFIRAECSGDGCTAFLSNRAMTMDEVRSINQGLAQTGEAGKMRLSSIPTVKDPNIRDNIKKRGEDLEKKLVQQLSGGIEPQRIRGLVLGVHMGSKPELIISEANGFRLSKPERELIQNQFQKLIRQEDH
jgi:hypothetical protein